MRATKTEKIIIRNNGSFIGVTEDSFIIKHNDKETRTIPFYKVGEIILKTRNCISTNALLYASIYNIDVLITSPLGKPIATFQPIKSRSHVKTRLKQYEAFKSEKGIEIAKQFIYGKVKAQTQVLKKYKLLPFESTKLPSIKTLEMIHGNNVDFVRHKLTTIEATFTKHYFKQILPLFPKKFHIDKRDGFQAYDRLNNLLNLAYEVLKWKIFRALINAKLEPYLGFLHAVRDERASLVCDFQELYRAFIDDFLIGYVKHLKRSDFKLEYGKGRTPRNFLKYPQSTQVIEAINRVFERKVTIQRIKHRGLSQRFETLINEEAVLLAMYIRNEKPTWKPRIPPLP